MSAKVDERKDECIEKKKKIKLRKELQSKKKKKKKYIWIILKIPQRVFVPVGKPRKLKKYFCYHFLLIFYAFIQQATPCLSKHMTLIPRLLLLLLPLLLLLLAKRWHGLNLPSNTEEHLKIVSAKREVLHPLLIPPLLLPLYLLTLYPSIPLSLAYLSFDSLAFYLYFIGLRLRGDNSRRPNFYSGNKCSVHCINNSLLSKEEGIEKSGQMK